ncbi:tripartite motif-containing protein 16-like protein [Danio aesculapii]|uniref:tripartite motif-containing protein 16-like protein n=1 Tax=Danio aesculapii TaxID=1142201 RepID=UPI0024C06882|nr:tripartite motif-containing protein 16-like protein [Danio aesculapii]
MADEQDPHVRSVYLQDLSESSSPPDVNESVASTADLQDPSETTFSQDLNVSEASTADQQDLSESTCPPDMEESVASAADLQDLSESSCPADPHVSSVSEQLESTVLESGGADVKDVYCETHLRTHAANAHLLVHSSGRLQGETCREHQNLPEVYGGHNTTAQERTEKQSQLQKSKQMIRDRETELKEMRKAAGNLRNLTKATEEEGDRIFTDMLSFIRRSHTEMMNLLQTQMSVEMDRIQEHLEQLDQEIHKLKRKHSELEQLSTEDHLHLLQSTDVPSLTANPQFSFGEMIKSLSSLTAQIQDVWRREISSISSAVITEKILLPVEPKTRDEFLQFLVPLSLDPNTAHRSLRLSDQNRAVACSPDLQPYPEHPQRFQWWAQVLSRERLFGRCYWEAEWSGRYGVDIAVSYRDIGRTGEQDDAGFGYNTHSWSLDCSERYAVVHDNVETEVSVPASRRIGVYLDTRVGFLCFYSVSDRMILLHRLHTRFNQPLHPGFGLFQGSAARFCSPEMDKPKNKKASANQRHRTMKKMRKSRKHSA